MADMVGSQGLVASSAKTGQVRGLAGLLNAGAAPDSFRPVAWHLLSCSGGHYVLGDSCVMARAEDGSLGSLVKAGRNWSEVYLPISSRQVLAGARAQTDPSLADADINRGSATFALRYVYTSSIAPGIGGLQALIETGEPVMSQDELAQLVRRCFSEPSGWGDMRTS
jgi:hypothetical protein